MNPAGSIALVCDAPGGRTRLQAIRCEGLSRTSRAFAAPGGAIRVMFSALGPGVIAGDRFAVDGRLDERAALLACGQMATPVFAGAGRSRGDAAWRVADGATLVSAPEPLLLEPGSDYAAGAEFAVSGSGRALAVDTFALRGSARLSMRTRATIDGRLVYRDAFEVSGERAGAFGTVALICADAAARGAFLARAAQILASAEGVRGGCGETAGAAIVRLHGTRVWDVRTAAAAIGDVTSA